MQNNIWSQYQVYRILTCAYSAFLLNIYMLSPLCWCPARESCGKSYTSVQVHATHYTFKVHNFAALCTIPHFIMSRWLSDKTLHLESQLVVWNQGFWYILVHTGIYLYVLVHTGTNIYIKYIPVCTSMYRVCTGLMTCRIAIYWGTLLGFKHNHIPVQYSLPLCQRLLLLLRRLRLRVGVVGVGCGCGCCGGCGCGCGGHFSEWWWFSWIGKECVAF